ncbi:ABC transporter ATP-binding protein [Candidatus Desantisbacteria bacterium]|nr:ABC transporter ATP-binding protein [Candidatus Desantisbacteria bacterium]
MLEIKNMTCGYDNKFLLKNINFKMNCGERIGIIGPNGSGKTTFMHAMTRLLPPKEGEILFNGKNIWEIKNKDLAKKIAIVTQDSPANFITVEEFVLMGRIPHFENFQFIETKNDIDIAEHAMHLTDVVKFRDKTLNQLSGGERQLVHIACALAQQPILLFLDEPTSHLDITHQVKIMDLIYKLNKELGLSVVMILHDLNLAGEYCEKLILLNNGSMYKNGSPEEVLTYSIIEEVYRTTVIVKENPLSLKPYVFLVSGRGKETAKDFTTGH